LPCPAPFSSVAAAEGHGGLTSDRPYRAALAPGQALGLMSDLAGTKLDAAMVDALAFLKDCRYSAAA
jgi:HD-GYP domain-containing protein (c-di-GMP phosphodiesterase class II)